MSSPVLFPPIGFAFHIGSNDHETNTLGLWCNLHKIQYRHFRKASEVPKDWVPSGTVPWVESVLGRLVRPDYFPEFLRPYFHRKIWTQAKWPYGHRVFIKPADQHKRFTGFVTSGTWKGKKRGPYWCSEIVSFTNEWRYYVTNGSVVDARWYWGDQVNTPPPPTLDVQWPSDFCGTGDFGTLADGRLALVEAHPPFACGWYGRLGEGEIYARWLCAGWASLKTPANFPVSPPVLA